MLHLQTHLTGSLLVRHEQETHCSKSTLETGDRQDVFQSLSSKHWKKFVCPQFSIQPLDRAAVFLAEVHYTNVGDPKIIEDALADFAVTGRSGEYDVGTAVAFARRKGKGHSHDPIDDCEIARIPVVLAVQHGLATMAEAVAAIVG